MHKISGVGRLREFCCSNIKSRSVCAFITSCHDIFYSKFTMAFGLLKNELVEGNVWYILSQSPVVTGRT